MTEYSVKKGELKIFCASKGVGKSMLSTMTDHRRDAMLEKCRQQQAEAIKRMQYQEQHKRLQECLDRWAALRGEL